MRRRDSRPKIRSTLSAVAGAWKTCSIVAAALLFGSAILLLLTARSAAAQQAVAGLPSPEPIYWKQNLFLIPYQWSSAADPAAAQAVWLYVSKDNGLTWQKISEAKPHVKAFNYHAETDGAYAFAIRTIDATGRALPEAPHQPELVVVVDTTIPKIEELAGFLRPDGILDVRWRASDQNIDPASLKIEAQMEPGGAWLGLPTNQAVAIGQISWQPRTDSRVIALRATIFDRAGNSAVSQAALSTVPIIPGATHPWPAESDSTTSWGGTTAPIVESQVSVDAAGGNSGWTSTSTATAFDTMAGTATNHPVAPASQPWPAGARAHAPFRFADGGDVPPTDTVTTYGQPSGIEGPRNQDPTIVHSPTLPDAERYALADSPSRPAFRPLEPFRQASLPIADGREQGAGGRESASLPPAPGPLNPALPPNIEPKQVGSRTFALEYELANIDRWGASRVELWGTRDAGQTWQRFAESQRTDGSPLYVTVDSPGLYGFRIVVETPGGPPADVPRTGDQPELWVAVDLDRPHAELISVQPGSGNMADHLLLRWRASDENLESRPIGLFYSSRSTGPWSAIATALENTGAYTWRVERFVPSRIYLRLEARDKAGNLAAYQTAEPITIQPPQPAGMLRAVQPIGPTATGADAAYR